MPKRAENLVGQKFGLLTVIDTAPNQGTYRRWRCRCDCGVELEARGGNLQTGNTKSCGCAKRALIAKLSRTHGMANRSAEYFIWKGMRERCNTKSHSSYARYGGRGIRVCERWNSFEAFLSDMGPRPSSDYSIERNDNNGHYEPGNCRWATAIEQANNTRNSRRITAFGKTQTLARWSLDTGINKSTIALRIQTGWSIEDALSKQPSWQKLFKREALSEARVIHAKT